MREVDVILRISSKVIELICGVPLMHFVKDVYHVDLLVKKGGILVKRYIVQIDFRYGNCSIWFYLKNLY